MNTTTPIQLQEKIEAIKNKLMAIDDMRPGGLSKQYNVCGTPSCRCKDPVKPKKHGPYFKLSYTLEGRSSTEFVKKQHVAQVKKQIENFRRFKLLTGQWVKLAWRLARLRTLLDSADSLQASTGKKRRKIG